MKSVRLSDQEIQKGVESDVMRDQRLGRRLHDGVYSQVNVRVPWGLCGIKMRKTYFRNNEAVLFRWLS